MSNPKVSVIMPAYNAARTLREAVGSILNQTFPDIELIVCDDASTDVTSSVLQSITDERLRVIHNEVNLGSGLSRDKAIDISTGEMLAFADADDAWEPERLEVLLDATVASKNTMVFDDILECFDTPSGMKPWQPLRGSKAFGGDGKAVIDVPIDQFICQERLMMQPLVPSGFLKKGQVRHSALSFAQDTEFFLALMSKGMALRFVPRPMYRYRITPGSATAQRCREAMMLQVLKEALGKFHHMPSVQAALRKKIKKASRNEQYMSFFRSLKEKKIHEGLLMAMKSPWLIAEFVKRSGRSTVYHAHRIYHGGGTRGIR